MKIIRNPIFLGLALIFLVWLFNKLYYNQLLERYDKALEEHERLLELDSLQQIKLDSLQNVFDELNKIDDNVEEIDTIVIGQSNTFWTKRPFSFLLPSKNGFPNQLRLGHP